MPFKLRLKRSKQYNVVSKSLFVICVELLDGNSIECTLSSESVGRDCLDNVCQRLGLQQPEFFGLRYVNRNGQSRWVELERPLKKQLDKNARDMNLCLRIMFYVSGVGLIHEENTRYHYFLQLKSDVIEGRINCNHKQASMLASYSMQAEFGNHDLERHTAEYLKDFALFPKHLTQDGHLESLIQSVILQHSALAGLPQGTAEEYYILAAQQLEGYGLETFEAKDYQGKDVIIGVSLNGIIISFKDNSPPNFYRWKDITNVVNHKRNFGMELQDPSETPNFQLPDVETAKYIWRMCVHQHQFFREFADKNGEFGSAAQVVRNLFTQIRTDDMRNGSSHEELDRIEVVPERVIVADRHRAQSTSCLDLAHSNHHDVDRLRSLLPSYRPAPDYETAIQNKIRGHAIMYSSQPEIHQTNLPEGLVQYTNAYKHFPDVARVERAYLEQPEENHAPHNLASLHYSTPELDGVDRGVLVHLYKPPPPYRPNSNSTPDLASQPYNSHHTFINNQHMDEAPNNNFLYFMGRGNAFIHQQPNDAGHLAQQTFIQRTPADKEPIYENVPFPWAQESEQRSRAASIQSAPEIRPPLELDRTGNFGSQQQVVNKKPQMQQQQFQNAPQVIMPQVLPPTPAPRESIAEKLQTAPNLGNLATGSKLMSPTMNVSNSNLTHDQERIPELDISVDSSARSSDGSNSGTMGKTAKSKGRKWATLLGGGNKNKASANLTLTKINSAPRIPVSQAMSKEATCQLLEKKLGESQLFFEFEKIPKQRNNANFTVAMLPENTSRNRFSDVLPYEDNRVRLSPSKENRHGYINASHITATVGSQQRFYIAAQSPLNSTIGTFWQMVWEAEVYLIIALPTPGEEIAPCLPTPERRISTGQFDVVCLFSQTTGHCGTTKLRLHHTDSRSSRGVWHLQYSEWGHQGCPNSVPHFLGFLEELSSVRQHTITEIPAGHNKNPPVLVHCSSGVGPTAVTILSDLLLFAHDHNQELDVARVVYLLRHQRMLMIQNISQWPYHRDNSVIHYFSTSTATRGINCFR
ncbi:tyrosine phosphatase, non-receptor type nt6 [Nesidiocoris tenuis]|uniref:protein-tyrosine-phosphatase n=1 Tax=Nesidiocoris tenuis TaxID=355587 RepID=A0ABN7AMW5_9HEMI|nr:tyrosine phosphatase, non-receptor type nt6 [Nesidiocoris tenuis]